MKKLGLLAISVFFFSSLSFGQTPVINRSWDIKAVTISNQCSNDTSKACSPVENIANRGLSAHIFSWSVQSGTFASCNIDIQTSPDNKSSSTWTTQYTGDCAGNGTSNYLSFVANFIRVKANVFTVTSGTALVTINYAGYVIPPTNIATITTAPVNNANINNIRFGTGFSGADAGVQLRAAMDDLPSTGGYIYDNFEGTKPITPVTFPSKIIHLVCSGGAIYVSTSTAQAAFTMSAGSTIEHCNIKVSANGASADGIIPAQDAKILYNTLTGNTTFSSGASAIDGCNCTGVEIAYNKITLWGGHGVNTGGNDNNGYWDFHNNQLYDIYDDGMLLSGVGHHKVIHNTFQRIGSNSIDINSSNNIVKDNQIDHSGINYYMSGIDGDSILVTSAYGEASNNTIGSNTITYSYGEGIRVRADASGFTVGTIITENNISRGLDNGILLDSSIGATCGTINDTLITNNHISKNAANGILQGGGAGSPCVITGTLVTVNSVTSNVGVGIYITYGIGATVSHNFSNGNTGGNINVVSSTTPFAGFNRTDPTSQDLGIETGSFLLGTFKPPSAGNETIFQSPGNSQLTIHSAGGGSYRDYSLLSVSDGTFNIYDKTAALTRLKFGSNGEPTFTIGAGGTTFNVTSPGNTLIDLLSTAGGTRHYGAALIDTSGNFYTGYDITGGGSRIKINSSGATLIEGAGGLVVANTIQSNGAVQVAPTVKTLANGANNNIVATNISWIRISGPTGSFSVTGFSGGVNGQILYLFNTTSQQMTLANNSGSSSSGNKLSTLTGADIVLRSGVSFATLMYDSSANAWDVVSTN